MKEIICEAKIKKRYFKIKNVVRVFIKIISEVENIVEIKNLYAYTPDKLKFSNLDLLDCISKNKELSGFECPDDTKAVLIVEKNQCRITIHYEKSAIYNTWGHVWPTTHTFKIHLRGPEKNVKQERETLRNLL